MLVEKKFGDLDSAKEVLKGFLQANISKEDLIKVINGFDRDECPLGLLRIKNLSNLEAIVKYLRENKKMTYKEIGKKINRNHLMLASVYKNAKKKMSHKIVLKKEDYVPFNIFKKELGVLECIVLHLSNQGLKQVQISKLLEKKPSTIWITLQRANIKQSRGIVS